MSSRTSNRAIVVAATAALAALGIAYAGTEPWVELPPRGPVERWNHDMIGDPRHDVVVLFGGQSREAGALGDTWEWDGAQWRRVATSGPPARAKHHLAYDARRGVVVLFGGTDTDTGALYGDTWEWDGTQWTEVAVTGPAPRVEHQLAYDERRGVVVLFGGQSEEVDALGDTWEWDGTAWSLRAEEGPAGRLRFGMAYDAARGVTVLVGGARLPEFAVFNGTWQWDGQSWTRVSTALGKADHVVAYDRRRGVIVLFGGQGDGTGDETWEWAGAEAGWSLVSERDPDGRYDAALAYDAARGIVLLAGGRSGDLIRSDRWALTGLRIDTPRLPPCVAPGSELAYVAELVNPWPVRRRVDEVALRLQRRDELAERLVWRGRAVVAAETRTPLPIRTVVPDTLPVGTWTVETVVRAAGLELATDPFTTAVVASCP